MDSAWVSGIFRKEGGTYRFKMILDYKSNLSYTLMLTTMVTDVHVHVLLDKYDPSLHISIMCKLCIYL